MLLNLFPQQYIGGGFSPAPGKFLAGSLGGAWELPGGSLGTPRASRRRGPVPRGTGASAAPTEVAVPALAAVVETIEVLGILHFLS